MGATDILKGGLTARPNACPMGTSGILFHCTAPSVELQIGVIKEGMTVTPKTLHVGKRNYLRYEFLCFR